MKKLFLLPLFGFMFASCADELTVENEGGVKTPGVEVNSYLSLSLVPAQEASTRAYAGEYDGDKDGGGKYVDGKKEENNVKRVRFFFFDNDGEPVPVWKTSQQNDNSYIDWYPTDADMSGNDHKETVEKILSATLGLSYSDDKKPASVMAIINPTDEILDLGNATFEGLQGIVNDFKTNLQIDNFVMSNAVYVNNDKAVYTTALADENFCETPEKAVANAVEIYVERVLARLDFAINMEPSSLGDNIYKITKPSTKPSTEPGEEPDEEPGEEGSNYVVADIETEAEMEIYVELLGWNITATYNKSRLVKEVDPSWTSNQLFGATRLLWNTADYHRSFWALNPDPNTEGLKYLYGNFGQVDEDYNIEVSDSDYPAIGKDIPKKGEYETVYLQENASAYGDELTGPADSTKVIIAAQLLNSNGKPLSLAMWGYKYYTLDQLKVVFANRLNLYYEIDDNDWKKIEPEHIGFMTWEQLKAAYKKAGEDIGDTEDADYYVYPVLSTAGEAKTWHRGNQKEDNTELTVAQANTLMRDELNRAMVWNNGWTYYYFDVRHLGLENSVGHIGIVRNHLYATTVTSLKGLGTPVYNPDQVIFPEKPEYDESIVSASVKILSWRVVSQDYDIEWK